MTRWHNNKKSYTQTNSIIRPNSDLSNTTGSTMTKETATKAMLTFYNSMQARSTKAVPSRATTPKSKSVLTPISEQRFVQCSKEILFTAGAVKYENLTNEHVPDVRVPACQFLKQI